jgi:hypothetical protein
MSSNKNPHRKLAQEIRSLSTSEREVVSTLIDVLILARNGPQIDSGECENFDDELQPLPSSSPKRRAARLGTGSTADLRIVKTAKT